MANALYLGWRTSYQDCEDANAVCTMGTYLNACIILPYSVFGGVSDVARPQGASSHSRNGRFKLTPDSLVPPGFAGLIVNQTNSDPLLAAGFQNAMGTLTSFPNQESKTQALFLNAAKF